MRSRPRLLGALVLFLLVSSLAAGGAASATGRSPRPDATGLGAPLEATLPHLEGTVRPAAAGLPEGVPGAAAPLPPGGAVPAVAPRGPISASAVSSVSVGRTPFPSVYDSGNGYVDVMNTGSADVSAVQDDRVVGTATVGGTPGFAAYDAGNGYVYVPNKESNNLSVLAGTQVVASVDVGMAPRFAAYDSANGYVYVANFFSDTVSVVSGTSVIATVNVGGGPLFETFDRANGYVYVENTASDDVSVLSGTSVIALIGVRTYPHAAALDPVNGYLYVPNFDSSDVSVIAGSRLIGTVLVGPEPTDAIYDAEDGDVYVTSYGSSTLSVINGTRVVGTVNVGNASMYGAYDDSLGAVFVPNDRSANVSVVVGTRVVETLPVGSLPEYATYDPGNGYVFVSDSGSGSVTVIHAPRGYPVTFTETGLPVGTSWFVIVNGTQLGSTTPTIVLAEPNGTYSYTISSEGGLGASPSWGSLTVAAAPTTVALTFSPQPTYTVAFTETGLPTGTNWSVTVNGAALWTISTTIAFQEADGAAEYVLGMVPGWTTSTFSGGFVVNGSSVSTTVAWMPSTYVVTFWEVGLPRGSAWSVNLPGVTSASGSAGTLSMALANGSYPYIATGGLGMYSAPGGSFAVAGQPLTITVTFTPNPYAVTFVETGLPIGTNWSVTLHGQLLASTTLAITFMEVNGSFAFVLGALPGWTTSRFSGTVTVDGTPVSTSVAWLPVTYPVTFTETGLVAGTSWWVNASGVPSIGSSTSALSIEEPNGSYFYSAVTTDSTYTAPPGAFMVNGTAYQVQVPFTRVTYSVAFWENGLPAATPWSVTIAGVTVAGVGHLASVALPNGSYHFEVAAAAGYASDPSAGSVHVRGAPTAELIAFAPRAQTFLGLPSVEGYVVLGGLAGALSVGAAMAVLWKRGRRPPAPAR